MQKKNQKLTIESFEKLPEAEIEKLPYFIAYEYNRFFELLEERQYYGAFFEMKDILEVLLKFPVLIGTAYVEKYGTQSDIDKCITTLLEKRMSLGDWEQYGKVLYKTMEEMVQSGRNELVNIIEDICNIYADKQVVNWRNTKIAHGATVNDISQYQKDLIKFHKVVNKHLRKYIDAYGMIKLRIGDCVLQGSRLPEHLNYEKEIRVQIGDYAEFDMESYIFVEDSDFYFFDSMDSYRLMFYGLDYVNGRKITTCKGPFVRKYQTLVKKRMGDNSTVSGVLYREENEFLNRLNDAKDFAKMKNLSDWFKACLRMDCGVFLLEMARGMGKTAFVSSMDPFLNKKCADIDLDFSEIRCYYCSRLEYQSTQDFISSCNESLFSCSKIPGKDLRPSNHELKSLSLNCDKPEQQMIDYLDDYLKIYQDKEAVDKICLIIDGLDEITPDYHLSNGRSIFDYIPTGSSLPEGTFIFLTSRKAEDVEDTPFVAEGIRRIRALATDVKTVERDSDEHAVNMQEYIEAYARKRGQQFSQQEINQIIEKTDRNFVQLKLFFSLIQSGIKINVLLNDEQDLFHMFMVELYDSYGDRMYREAKRFLMLVASAYEPLSIEQIAFLSGSVEIQTRTLVIIRDLECLLSFDRTPEGTKIRLANKEHEERICEETRDLLKEQVMLWIDMIVNPEKADRVHGDEMRLYENEGAIYLHGTIMRYVRELNDPEIWASVKCEEFVEALFEFELRLDSKNHGYQSVLKDIEMSAAVIELLENRKEEGQPISELMLAQAHNCRAYHTGITLTDRDSAERDFQQAYDIVSSILIQGEAVLHMKGTICNNMAAIKNKYGDTFEEIEIWSKRSMHARRERMERDFDAGVEDYMRSILNYSRVLYDNCRGEALREAYEEMRSLYNKITDQHPDDETFVCVTKNRENYGYVSSFAMLQQRYAQWQEKEGDLPYAEELIDESIAKYRNLIEMSKGKQMELFVMLYKGLYYQGKIYDKQGKDASASWSEALDIVKRLSDCGKLFNNGTLMNYIREYRELLKQQDGKSAQLSVLDQLSIEG